MAFGQKTIDSQISGRHEQFRLNFPIKRPKHTPPYDWKQIGAMMDAVEEGVRDDGTIVIKRPDIWSQARMTKFRMEFHKQFEPATNNFTNVLSGQRARSDQQRFESATTISATLDAITATRNTRLPILQLPGRGASNADVTAAFKSQMDLNKAQTDQLKNEADANKAISDAQKSAADRDKALIDAVKSLVDTGTVTPQDAFKLLNDTGKTLSNAADNLTPGRLGIEPTVYLDEKKRYYEHLNQIRRVNLGDDMADSAGYSITLARLPVSIQPGARTLAGHGALLNVTVKPEFGNQYMQETFRNLVVADVVDILTPMVYSIIESGGLDAYQKLESEYDTDQIIDDDVLEVLKGKEVFKRIYIEFKKNGNVDSSQVDVVDLKREIKNYFTLDRIDELESAISRLQQGETKAIKKVINDHMQTDKRLLNSDLVRQFNSEYDKATNPNLSKEARRTAANAAMKTVGPVKQKDIARATSITDSNANTTAILNRVKEIKARVSSITNAFSSSDTRRSIIVAPIDIDDVFSPNNALIDLAERYRETQTRQHPSVSELRIFLNRSVQAAYDYVQSHFEQLQRSPVSGGVDYFEAAFLAARDRKIATSEKKYDEITKQDDTQILKLYRGSEIHDGFVDIVSPFLEKSMRASSLHSILTWAVVVDSGLLNDRLKQEMNRYDGREGFSAPADLDVMRFYVPSPKNSQANPQLAGDYITAEETFKAFVAARWPVICFALDPVTDQQNIGDSASLRRDLQLAMAMAFSSGQITASQFNRFRRLIGEDTETIALNKTVTAYSHSNDTFGWRFYPRFQNAPIEPSNLHSFANQMVFGGPPRNYQMKNSKLEPGQRELTAVMIVPSIVQGLRFEVNSNWFPLTKPDNMTIPNTRMLWQGEQLMQVRQAMQWLCDHNEYRPGDIDRMMVKLEQLEKMLPMQTEIIRVPYENNQSGYDLFTPGLSALGPILLGAEGINELPARGDDNQKEFWVVAYGKNLSLTDTYFIMGGKDLDNENSVKVVSREIVQLKIPKEAVVSTSRDGKRHYIELRAVTPTGISNVIELPVHKPEPPAPKPASSFSIKSPPTIVYVDFDEDDGSVKTANVENRNQYEFVIEDSSSRVIKDKPKQVTALRLDFLEKDKSAFNHAASFDVSTPVNFEKGIARPGIQAVKLIESAVKEDSGLKKSTFKDKTTYVVKGSMLVDNHSFTIPLEGSFEVTLVEEDSEKSPRAALSRLKHEPFDSIHQGTELSARSETPDAPDRFATREPKAVAGQGPGRSPFSQDLETTAAANSTKNERQIRFQDLIGQSPAEKSEENDEAFVRGNLPPALTPPADEMIERRSFVRERTVPATSPNAAGPQPARSRNPGPVKQQRSHDPRYSSTELDAARKTGIPLPTP